MSDSDPVSVARGLYEAFTKRDGDAMARLYSPDAIFSDPVFPRLSGAQVGGMWKMLCGRSTDLTIRYSLDEASGEVITIRWWADYSFGKERRRVRNRVTSRLVVRDGRIVRQEDRFGFWRWAAQALGATGVILGWAPPLRNRIRRQAAESLARFMET